MTTVSFVLPTFAFFAWLLATLAVASVIHTIVQRVFMGKGSKG